MQKIRVEKERVHMKLQKMGNAVLINILIWTIFQATTAVNVYAHEHLTYTVHDVNVTYKEAWHLCLQDGGWLAEFSGEDDSNLNSLITTVELPSYSQFWVNDTEAFMVKQTCTYLSTERNSSRCDFTAANCSIKLGYICQARRNKTGIVDHTDGPSTTLQPSGDTEMYSEIPDSYNSSEALISETTETPTSTASIIIIPDKKATENLSSSSDSTTLYNSSGAPSSETTESDTTTLINTTYIQAKTTASLDFTTSCNSTEAPPSETTESYTITARNITSPKTETTMFSSILDSTALYNSSERLLRETTVAIATTTDPQAKTTLFLSSSSALYNSSKALPSKITESHTTTPSNTTDLKAMTTSKFSSSSDSTPLFNSSDMLSSETTESSTIIARNITSSKADKSTTKFSSGSDSAPLYNSSKQLPSETNTPWYTTSLKTNKDTQTAHNVPEISTDIDIVSKPENSNLDSTYMPASNCTQLCCTNYHLVCHEDRTVNKQNKTKIFHEMNIDKTTTGKHIRRLSSASDSRTSSKTMGIGAMLIIGSIVACVVAMDIPIVVNYIRGVHHLNYPDSV